MDKKPNQAVFAEALKAGVLIFKYVKKDGSDRFALGTLKPELIPSKYAKYGNEMMAMLKRIAGAVNLSDLPTVGEVNQMVDQIETVRGYPPPLTGYQTYYDLEVCEFRKFMYDKLIEVMTCFPHQTIE